MKELSIEEKARAYDEAIEKAKTLYENAKGMILKKWVERVFPELKESDDERIRKAILWCISTVEHELGCKVIDGFTATELKSWLEKQGEQRPAGLYPVFRIGDIIERKDGQGTHLKITSIPGNFYHCIKMVYSEDDTSFCDIPIKNQDIFQISPDFGQKPAWSEEDENMFENTIGLIEVLDRETKGAYITKKYIKYLKSLKERVQPKQEWSEEDKEQLDRALYMMEQLDMTKSWDDVYNWLKSLKYRYTWKPSDEQMIELRRVISGCSYDIEPLVEMEEQLKKLRKE